MFNCQECEKYATCRKICEKVAILLSKAGIYGKDYIRPRMGKGGKNGWREMPFSSLGKWEELEMEDKNGED